MDLAVVWKGSPKPSALVTAVGWPALAAVGSAGLTVGFFLWYALALRGPHGAAFLDVTLPAALVLGLLAIYGLWFAYGRYFARRTHVPESTALRYDAAS
ncbi:MAG TPA: hypothetical protein VE591_02580, partial [Candidatus Acidoferrum sp.]|nr:hypothetical protein [Candidatus Acidoferrum sp.]